MNELRTTPQQAFQMFKDSGDVAQYREYLFMFVGHGWDVFEPTEENYITFVPQGEDTNTFEELYDDLEDVLRMERMQELGVPTATAVFNLH